MECTPVSVEVTSTHLNTATSEEIKFAFLRLSEQLPTLLDVEGYTIQYVGDRAVETNSEITLSGVPDREMGETEQEFFESVARDFLASQVVDESDNDSLRILSVTVNGQEITSEDTTSNTLDEVSSTAIPEVRNAPHRRLNKANNIQVSVKGTYRPPPELNFGELVNDSINRDRELLKKELNKPKELQESNGDELAEESTSAYFENTEVVGAREIKEEPVKPLNLGVVEEDDGMKGMLDMIAMVIGGLIAFLILTFFLRPHRRRALFSSGGKDKLGHRKYTQNVDVEDQNLLRKNRALIRGGNSFGESFYSTGGDSSYHDDKNKFNPRGSANSGGFNPRGSANSGNSGGSLRSFGAGANGGGGVRHSSITSGGSGGGGVRMSSITSGAGSVPSPYPPQSNRNLNMSMPPVRGLPPGQNALMNSMPPSRGYTPLERGSGADRINQSYR